jgi:hypothetical protein
MFVRTQDPAVEPVAVETVKVHRASIDSTQDYLLSLMISMAREYAEAITGRSFITQKWKLVADHFPGPQLVGSALEQRFGYPSTFGYPTVCLSQPLLLQKGPFQSIDSITYVDMNTVTQTVDPADYVADLDGMLARITPPFGKIWPITLPQIAAVKVNFTAGYGDTPDAVPAGIKHWIMLRVGSVFENREEVAIMNKGKIDPLPYVDYLLDPYRVRIA